MSDIERVRNELFDQAAEVAGKFLQAQAGKKAAELGFSYEPTTDAPNTYGDLRDAWEYAKKTGTPLPVSSIFSEGVPYPEEDHLHAQRFYHDCIHMLTGLTFDLADEIVISRIHVQDIASSFAPDSLAYKILHADLVDQVLCQGVTQKFVSNQGEFIRDVVDLGYVAAIVRERQR